MLEVSCGTTSQPHDQLCSWGPHSWQGFPTSALLQNPTCAYTRPHVDLVGTCNRLRCVGPRALQHKVPAAQLLTAELPAVQADCEVADAMQVLLLPGRR